ncbi:MAG: co-chaperone GroES [Chloroflexi bacterium]|mgnify:CR=1 FL=1|jgi:chaperonin GroES|nr:co-chaperone GroES [Chloroflexota bacterium]MBT7082372.1 co-chaperone GroES [Chloroflexota bacterium]MBT7290612.1 co-chaperone GroES [Chloroflexota bacterium]
MNLKPLGDRIIVKPIAKEEVTKGGIVLPDTVKEKPQEGDVVAVGPGRATEDGTRVTLEVKVGDTIVYPKYSGTEIKDGGEEYLIMRESEILAKKG